jgi:hypothetical protein
MFHELSWKNQPTRSPQEDLMAGGTGTTMKVSATLRGAGLPVLRWSDAADHLSRRGIYVRNGFTPGQTDVSLHFSDKPHGVREELVTADAVEAVLLARGFAYTRHTLRNGTAYSFTVYRTHEDPLYRALLAAQTAEKAQAQPETPADPEQAATAACGLQVTKLTQTDWRIAHGGQRNAYTIKRTGTGERARYAATAKGGRQIDKGLRTLAEALIAIQTDIDTQEA